MAASAGISCCLTEVVLHGYFPGCMWYLSNSSQCIGNSTLGKCELRGFLRELAVMRNVWNAEMFGAPHEGESKRQRHDVWECLSFSQTHWSALVSYSNQSYVSHPPQAASLIITERNKAVTPTGTAHLTENTTQ